MKNKKMTKKAEIDILDLWETIFLVFLALLSILVGSKMGLI